MFGRLTNKDRGRIGTPKLVLGSILLMAVVDGSAVDRT